MNKNKYKIHKRVSEKRFIIGQYDSIGYCEAIFDAEANWKNNTFYFEPIEKYRSYVEGYCYKTVDMTDVKAREEK